ncbi:MAG TPA: transposase [Holosporales bacterium]|nr:transposase [Holosporales bacterium]
MTYSLDLRRKIFSIKADQNLTFLEISQLFNISMATLFRWSKKIEPHATRHKPATKIDMDALKQDIEKYPDAYHTIFIKF